jgi:hypothetical protein
VAYLDTSGNSYKKREVTDSGVAAGDKGGYGPVYDRFALTIDTYNNLASMVNGIVSVVPVSFINIFPELAANSASPFGDARNTRPVNQYAGGLARSNGFSDLGIAVKTKSDLPASFATLFSETNKVTRYTVEVTYSVSKYPVFTTPGPDSQTYYYFLTTATPTVTGSDSIEDGPLLTEDWLISLFNDSSITEPATYFWVTIDSVVSFAAGFGLALNYQTYGEPCKLEIIEATEGGLTVLSNSNSPAVPYLGDGIETGSVGRFNAYADSRNNEDDTPTADEYVADKNAEVEVLHTEYLPAKTPAFLPTASSPEWLRDVGQYRVRENYDPARRIQADIIEFLGYSGDDGTEQKYLVATKEIVLDDAFLRRNWNDSIYKTQPFTSVDENYEIILFKCHGAAGSQVVRIPEPTLLWGPASPGTPVGSISAVVVANGSVGTPEQTALTEGDNFITANSVCERLIFYIDPRVSAG